MITERWNDEMLDRLSNAIAQIQEIVERNARTIESNARTIESNARAIEAQDNKLSETRDLINSNARIIQALANTAAEAAEERQRIFQFIAQQQAEIRGLQTENRRILDILLNERQEDDSDEN